MHDKSHFPVFIKGDKYSSILSKKYGYKEWMISRFLEFIPQPEKMLQYIEYNKDIYKNYIRINTLRISITKLKSNLESKGYILKDTPLKEVFEVNKKQDVKKDEKSKIPSIGSTVEYLRGDYYIQDLSSCIAVEEMDIPDNPNVTVLDMAAAPGGKTTFISQKMKNNGIVIAIEPNKNRLPALLFNLSRLQVKNTITLNIFGENVANTGIEFDRMLVDAPCTCEGLVLKDRSRKKSRSLKDIEICNIKQKMLIQAGFDVLKPNGIMVYSTCSFAPEENEMIVSEFLRSNKNAILEPSRYGMDGLTHFNNLEFVTDIKKTKRFYPHIHHTNGFYIAKIRKIE